MPFFEELISRTFLDENQFRLVSQDRVRSQNRIGCLVFVSRTVLSCLTHSPLINAECQEDSIVFLLKRPKWISHRWNFEFLFVQDWSRRSHQWQTTTITLQLNGFQKDFLNQAKMDLSSVRFWIYLCIYLIRCNLLKFIFSVVMKITHPCSIFTLIHNIHLNQNWLSCFSLFTGKYPLCKDSKQENWNEKDQTQFPNVTKYTKFKILVKWI